MWTVNNQRHAEPGPEVKAQVQALFEEWVITGDQRLIEQGRQLCGRGGHEWFQAVLVDANKARGKQEIKGSQTVHDVPGASTGSARAGATSSPDALAEVAPLATPKVGTLSPSTGASPPAGWDRRKQGRWVAPKAEKVAERSEAPKADPFFCDETQPSAEVDGGAKPEDARWTEALKLANQLQERGYSDAEIAKMKPAQGNRPA
jgi:hypothetical protein